MSGCDATTDGLESMLVCNESVDNLTPTIDTQVSGEESSSITNPVEQEEEALPQGLPSEEISGIGTNP